MPTIRQFFGFEEDPRTPEGWFSWQHLTYVTALVIAVILLGTTVGRHFRGLSFAQRRKPLRVAAVLMLALEAFKIILISIRSGDPWSFRSMLPLFLCSIILFTLPIAAFGRGRLAAAAMNFTFVFGMLCCLAGTYLAANYYDHSPVFRFITNNRVKCYILILRLFNRLSYYLFYWLIFSLLINFTLLLCKLFKGSHSWSLR